MNSPLDNPFYYLENFQHALEWIGERYSDLLSPDEQVFLERFPALPKASRALWVRMIMRKGALFRSSKLVYEEIGCPRQAAAALLEQGWLAEDPLLTLEQLFGLLTKSELATLFRLSLPRALARKADQLAALSAQFPDARTYSAWHGKAGDCVYQLAAAPLCERLRLLYFGNLRQDWSESVLADLGVYRYEKVECSPSSRGFRTRGDIDDYLHLHRCRERFEQGDPPGEILADIPAVAHENPWLERRRSKLLFRMAQHCERMEDWDAALTHYAACGFPGSRMRSIRVLERRGQWEAAFDLAQQAQDMPESEAEAQQLVRVMPRLRRKLGKPRLAHLAAPPAPVAEIELELPRPGHPFAVEDLVRAHLQRADAPAWYVENALINSLFGLLCWKAVFAAIPGAFFHPFQQGPADLCSADFQDRRRREFADCLSQLESGQYRQTIWEHHREKAGIQSPFVYWGMLSEELLGHALDCVPAAHLRKWFERILADVRSNRAGFPDLIQFRPEEKRYRMIEVKGPGDRLQDNQLRWLDYCAAHDMPVAVCYVRWTAEPECCA
jgi:VRR-NUC domain/Fanconi anemia-associated nuclease SAP domain